MAALQSDIALDGQLQQFVTAPQGLFPAPLPPHLLADSKVLSHFKLLGRAMAKALQDNRLLDLPLSYVFYRYKAVVVLMPCSYTRRVHNVATPGSSSQTLLSSNSHSGTGESCSRTHLFQLSPGRIQ